MKQQEKYGGDKQQGVALPIVMVILVLSAMIVLYMANTSKKEQQISADQYRTEQSLNAAMAGLDWATDYYNAKGLDDDNNNVVDYLSGSFMQWCIGDSQSMPLPIGQKCSDLVGLGDLVVQSRAFFCDPNDAKFWSNKPESCDDAVIGAKKVGVVSIGYSDDDTARRVITVVLAGAPLLPPAGPGQPLTTKSNVGFTGNITIINRYFNVNVMAGGPVTLDGSAITVVAGGDIPLGAERFDKDPDHRDRMNNTDTSDADSLTGSTEKRGINADALGFIPVLENLSTDRTGDRKDEFFQYFIEADKEMIKSAAEEIGQFYTNCDDLEDRLSGIIWVELEEGTVCKTGINFGSLDFDKPSDGQVDEPAAVFINGDMDLGGTVDVSGLLYVTGDLSIVGSPTIKGSVIVEGDFKTDKAGTLYLVYDPVAVTPGAGFLGRRSIVLGTWKDWALN